MLNFILEKSIHFLVILYHRCNMYEFKLFLFCVFIYLIQLPAGDGLRCGACSTNVIPDCADPSGKNISTQDCNKNKATLCRTVEYFNRRENRVEFSRACVEEFDLSNNTPCSDTRTAYFGNVRNCQTCNTDLCNINQGMTTQQSEDEQNFTTEQTDENIDNSSTALQSSFHILVTIVLFNFYRTYI